MNQSYKLTEQSQCIEIKEEEEEQNEIHDYYKIGKQIHSTKLYELRLVVNKETDKKFAAKIFEKKKMDASKLKSLRQVIVILN